ncbi:MAG: hypothetical protein K1Y02_26550, partial [Candidatus Hydrogenedentes bacterium]|nr:hypothetical protein [Candidatus Hydrogenedentota bacterium]
SLPPLPQRDWTDTNARSKELWGAFWKRANERAPVRLNTNPRVLLLNPEHNTRGITYEQYMTDPDVMGQGVLEWSLWVRHFLPGDHEHGLPEEWPIYVDFENTYDAAWLGCPVHFRDGQIPDTTPFLTDDTKTLLFDRGLPEPFAGEWPERFLAFAGHWDKKRREGWTWLDRPIGPLLMPSYAGTDGMFTAAVAVRGAMEFCSDMLLDPDYAHTLLEYLYEAMRTRMRAWRRKFDIPIPCDDFWLADDAVQMLSVEQYREFVLPWHRKLYDEFATHTRRGMHLCGNAQRHYPTIRRECGVTQFDTGFPVDFAAVRRELGNNTIVYGGPKVSFFLTDDPAPIIQETKRIAESGVLHGGCFVFQEGNNLPPLARLGTCEAFYKTAVEHGHIPRG